MQSILRGALLALGLGGFVLAGCATAADEEEVGQDEAAFTTSVTVTCSSNDHRYQMCRIDTEAGKVLSVRLARQISSAQCTEGTSWGFGDDHVWVDRGCRASFDVKVRKGPEITRSVSCSSNDNRPARCRTEFEEVTSFRLQRQISQARCTEGSTYGLDGDTIWVNSGCRATFELRGFSRNPPAPPPPPPGTSSRVTLHTFSECDDFFTIATLTPETNCNDVWQSPGSVKQDGVCTPLPAGTTGGEACRRYKPSTSGGGGGQVSFFRFEGCSSLAGSASSRAECSAFSTVTQVRSVRQNGVCRDITATDAERACLLYAP